MAENKVAVEITLEEKAALKALTQLSREVQKTEGSFKSMGDQGDESLGILTQASQGLSGGFKSLVGGVTVANLASEAIIGTANAVKNFVVGSVNAAIEQENAINKLNQALRASGDFSNAAAQDLIDFASGLQAVSKFGDEVVIGQLAVAKSFGASNEQAKQLVQAAANLSATFGGDLDSNVQKLGKTFSGQAGLLSRYLPELKNLTEEQLRAGKAAEIINSKFSGAAANELNTYQGKVTAMSNAYSDLQEELGRFFIENGLVNESISVAKSAFEGLNVAVRTLNQSLGYGVTPLQEQRNTLAELGREYNGLGDAIENLRKQKEASEKFGSGEASNLQRIAELTKAIEGAELRRNQIIAERQSLRGKINQDQNSVDSTKSNVGIDNDEIKKEQEKQAKIIQIREEANIALQQSYIEQAAWEAEQDLLKREITAQNYAAELEQLQAIEQEKINIRFAAEEQKAQAIQDAQTKQATLQKIAADKELAIEKSKVEAKRRIDIQQVQLEQQKQAALLGIAGATANLITAVTKEGSREAFLAQKAAALAQAIVATNTAAALALAVPPAPNVGLSALAKAAGAINIAAIAAQAIKGYNFGGIVPGSSTTGDRVPALVNSGEMILNRQQQSELFNIANGGGGSSGVVAAIEKLTAAIANQPVQVMIDKRKIAEAVRGEIQNGFRLT